MHWNYCMYILTVLHELKVLYVQYWQNCILSYVLNVLTVWLIYEYVLYELYIYNRMHCIHSYVPFVYTLV